MKYVGVDLHKKVISLCVVMQKAGQRVVVKRGTLRCDEPRRIQSWFRQLGTFQVTVEATSSYEWFIQLVEPLADRVVLAHPKKLRVIAESTRKTDKLDAQVLAEFLSLDMIPVAHRPSPRLREHRALAAPAAIHPAADHLGKEPTEALAIALQRGREVPVQPAGPSLLERASTFVGGPLRGAATSSKPRTLAFSTPGDARRAAQVRQEGTRGRA